jgi:hypothetical protein
MAQDYNYVETRDRGGYALFEMLFVEAGSPVVYDTGTDTVSQVDQNAQLAQTAAARVLDQVLSNANLTQNFARTPAAKIGALLS